MFLDGLGLSELEGEALFGLNTHTLLLLSSLLHEDL